MSSELVCWPILLPFWQLVQLLFSLLLWWKVASKIVLQKKRGNFLWLNRDMINGPILNLLKPMHHFWQAWFIFWKQSAKILADLLWAANLGQLGHLFEKLSLHRSLLSKGQFFPYKVLEHKILMYESLERNVEGAVSGEITLFISYSLHNQFID